ncbi:hypothetical protein ACPPVO_26040 [Dactylosporangium sp. McL0621]|uniref:hypothetical protein n=1 Tax=Dactylosporangium sp. McL0621 TaxID=3415678 RepID=UPI003CEC1305
MITNWGTFDRGDPAELCRYLALQALQGERFEVWTTDEPYLAIGGRGDCVVTVTVAPYENGGGTWIAVCAVGTSPEASERARNAVRDRIQHAVPPPIHLPHL